MKFKTTCTLIHINLIIMLLLALPSSGGMSSPSYRAPTYVLDSGISQSASKNFGQIGIIGEYESIAFSQNSNFINKGSFIPAFFVPPINKIPGDLDGNRIVDRDDVYLIKANLNQPANVCPECDIDRDGTITVLDARKIILLCTCPRCMCN